VATLEQILIKSVANDSLATDITDRLSQELVIALIGPVGSGVSTAGGILKELLSGEFRYDVAPIFSVSDIIRNEAHRVALNPVQKSDAIDEYIEQMQDAGNRLREKFGGNYLVEKVIERICRFRGEKGGYINDIPLPGRRAYIIDSLKNQEELDLLRTIYGETLCVFGVFAPDGIRKRRLMDQGTPANRVSNIIDRDQGEIASFGQKTRKLFVKSDFFVCNDLRTEELRARLSRFLGIMFDTAIHTPTREESAMYEASAAAAGSACMSRQVGAAIVSASGELIAVGWNDVPRYGGSLYREDDRSFFDEDQRKIVDRDHRCYNWGGKICHNETRRKEIMDRIADKICSSSAVKSDVIKNDIVSLISGTGIDDLIEFSRSIHAEMEAILSVAREGKHSLVGGTLYTSTYPCHNCARHIVASGINTVVYIEPYLKSLATELHSDVVTEDPTERSKVLFRQFNGVAPINYHRLFRPKTERKEGGRLLRRDPAAAVPIFRVPLDAQREYEDKVIADLSHKEQNANDTKK
jgi:deoxycytidylate deaminase